MSFLQLFVLVFAIGSLATSLFAMRAIWRSPSVRHKPLWMVGCVLGFFGFTTGWTTPSDLYFSVGISVSPINLQTYFASRQSVLQGMFPLIAVVALVKFGGEPVIGNSS